MDERLARYLQIAPEQERLYQWERRARQVAKFWATVIATVRLLDSIAELRRKIEEEEQN